MFNVYASGSRREKSVIHPSLHNQNSPLQMGDHEIGLSIPQAAVGLNRLPVHAVKDDSFANLRLMSLNLCSFDVSVSCGWRALHNPGGMLPRRLLLLDVVLRGDL